MADEPSMDSILSGASAVANEPERIVDEPENIIGTDFVAGQKHPDEVEPAKPAAKPEGKTEDGKTVPLAALQEERGKVKRYTEEVADFRKAQREQADQIARLNALLEQRQQAEQEKPDWYVDPEKSVKQELTGALTPVQAELAKTKTDLMRLGAIVTHGAEKVTAFESYVQEAYDRNDPEMAILSAQMRASPDPIGTGLKWFEQRTFDPAAERERLKAELLAEMQGGGQQQQQPAQAAPVMPSNFAEVRNAGGRGGSGWGGPPSIGDVLASAQRPKQTIFK